MVKHGPDETSVAEAVSRVGIACWLSETTDVWDSPAVLGTAGDDLCLMELDASNRERILAELVDRHDAGDHGLPIELAFFGDAGGFFASSMRFLALWPKSSADLPADVFIDDHYRAAFTHAGGEVLVTVRHALRPGGPPKRRLRFEASRYEDAMRELARESRRLCDDLIATAQQRAPHKVASLRAACDPQETRFAVADPLWRKH
jgi:hypothetical protein